MKIQIFSCGGTIDKVYFDASSEFEVGDPQIQTAFRNANVSFDYHIESLMRKDSLEMTSEDRELIRQRVENAPCERILITHGTDTMAETAESLLGIPDKTIVLTGSMMPARFHVTDAIFNIGCAVGALQAASRGVFIAMNGCLFSAGTVKKNRAAGRFETL